MDFVNLPANSTNIYGYYPHPGSTAYGNFHNFCRDSTLPVCNIFIESPTKSPDGLDHFGGCVLQGIPLDGDRYLRNLGAIILAFISIVTALFLLWRSERKKAAVGRREMQLFLVGYIIIEICAIFTIGGFPLSRTARIAFTGIHIAAITATTWILMLNGAVGYQVLDDGTVASLSLLLISAAAIFIGTGYIVLDAGFDWTGYWQVDYVQNNPNRSYAIYTLYFLAPLVFLFIYFVLEAYLVVKVLGEKKPMLFLIAAVLLFAIGQIFDFVISTHICQGVQGKIDGSLFQTLFTLLAVVSVWSFWSSITEDDWEQPLGSGRSGY